MTARPGRLYLHVLNYPPDRVLRVPVFAARIRAVRLMADGRELTRRKRNGDLLIDLPAVTPDPLDTVIELHHAGALRRRTTPTLLPGFPLVLAPSDARRRGRTVHRVIRWQEGFGNWKYADCLEAWRAENDTAAWTFQSVWTGCCHVELSYRFHPAAVEREGRLSCNGDQLFFQPLATGEQPHLWFEHRLGLLHVKEGRNRLNLQPLGPAGAFLQLRSVRLIPVD
jgi:alpha-L-fucosidase